MVTLRYWVFHMVPKIFKNPRGNSEVYQIFAMNFLHRIRLKMLITKLKPCCTPIYSFHQIKLHQFHNLIVEENWKKKLGFEFGGRNVIWRKDD